MCSSKIIWICQNCIKNCIAKVCSRPERGRQQHDPHGHESGKKLRRPGGPGRQARRPHQAHREGSVRGAATPSAVAASVPAATPCRSRWCWPSTPAWPGRRVEVEQHHQLLRERRRRRRRRGARARSRWIMNAGRGVHEQSWGPIPGLCTCT